MTTETREALKEFAAAVRILSTGHIHNPVDRCANRLIRALEQEGNVPTCSVCEGSGVIDPWGTAMRTPCPSCQREAALRHIERESTVKAIATNYETWRDEQLDTLRKLFRQRGFSDGYKSFPDFCREQWEGSDKGKVKV